MPRQRTTPKVTAAAGSASPAARLKLFGLSAANVQTSNNLEVPDGQTVVLDAADKRYAKQVAQLRPKSIDDLKAWFGVPDAAFVTPAAAMAAQPGTVIPVHDAYTPAQTTGLYSLARSYVFGHSASVNRAQLPALNQWLTSIASVINTILFQDIHVAVNATLVVNASITVLFARYITIDQGGLIKIKCSYGGINCAGIKGYVPPYIPAPGVVRLINQ
jgi:hypothetical protein